MSHFSIALQSLLGESREDQTTLAKRLDMSPSQLNKYYNGRALVGSSVLKKLLSAFPKEKHPPLVRAFLLDQVPTEYRQTIAVSLVGQKSSRNPLVEEAAASYGQGFPAELQRAFRTVGGKCHDRHVYDLVVDLSRLLENPKQ